MHKRSTYSILALTFLLSGCGAYLNQPTGPQQARTGEVSANTEVLRDMPSPSEQIVVGVYNFKDQTGQYKNLQNGSSFSTAVSQGATTMLIQALEDSKWFTPIERENLSNLLNERNIIRSTRDEFAKNNNSAQPGLPPLLYAGVLLEGAVVSYDTNIITGGAGARYFGAGASLQYRQDRISIYLRAVSTSNGKILKTVYVSKTILSQSVDASLFRYVSFQRLMEAETGFTKNEPVQLAMKDAIEKAVESLIIEGLEDDLWDSAEGDEKDQELIEAYTAEKNLEESRLLYDRAQVSNKGSNGFLVSATAPILNGDLGTKTLGWGVNLGYSKSLSQGIDFNVGIDYFNLRSSSTYSKYFIAPSINVEVDFLPYDTFAPFVYGGVGAVIGVGDESRIENVTAPKLQAGLGLSLRVTDKFDLRFFAGSDFTFSDELDGIESGKRDDFYYNLGVGIKYKLSSDQ